VDALETGGLVGEQEAGTSVVEGRGLEDARKAAKKAASSKARRDVLDGILWTIFPLFSSRRSGLINSTILET